MGLTGVMKRRPGRASGLTMREIESPLKLGAEPRVLEANRPTSEPCRRSASKASLSNGRHVVIRALLHCLDGLLHRAIGGDHDSGMTGFECFELALGDIRSEPSVRLCYS